MKKKVLIFLTVFLMNYININVFADVITDSTGKWEYNENADGTISIHSYLGNDTDIVIPSRIDNKTVVQIEDGAFISGTNLTKITIPEGVKSIEDGAFFGCISLKNFEVSSINSYYASSNGILMNKDKSKIVCFPANRIGTYSVPKTVTYIGKKAFAYSRLSEINISETVTYIGDYGFMYCINLRSVVVPSSIEIINEGTFSCCNNLASVTISEGVKTIGEYAFLCEKGMSSLEKIVIPKSVESIGEFAFENCDKMVIYGDNSSTAKDYAEDKGVDFENPDEDKKENTKSDNEVKTDEEKPTESIGGTVIGVEKVEGLVQKSSYATNAINMKWNKQKNAYGYEVYRATSKNGKYTKVKTTTSTTFKNSKLKSGKNYYYKVCAYKLVNGTKEYGEYSDTVLMGTQTAKPSIKVTTKKRQAKITWKKVNGANGYEVYMSSSKSGKYIKIKSTTSKVLTFTKKKLVKGKKYYFKVRAFRKVNGKKIYSGWSKVVKRKMS